MVLLFIAFLGCVTHKLDAVARWRAGEGPDWGCRVERIHCVSRLLSVHAGFC